MRRHAGGLKPPTPFFARPGNLGTYPGQATGARQGLPSCPPSQRGAQGEGGEKRREERRRGEGRTGKGREAEARPGSTHRARRAGLDRPRRPARCRGEGPGGGAAQAPIWKCQLLSAARPQPRRKRKSLRFPPSPAHRAEEPRVAESKVPPRQGLKETRHAARRGPAVSRPSRAAEPLKVFGPPPPAARPASCSVKPLLLPPPPFSNLPLQPSICAEPARPRLRRGPATPPG